MNKIIVDIPKLEGVGALLAIVKSLEKWTGVNGITLLEADDDNVRVILEVSE